MCTTTLKLPESLKSRIAPLAETAGRTAHAWMVNVLEDMECIVDFLLQADPDSALQTYDLVESALLLITKHPLIGRAL
jgi:predicted DNA-binding protein